MSKSRLPARRRDDLVEAIEYIEKLLDPSSGSGTKLSAQQRKDLTLYLNCWVLYKLKKLRHYARGGAFTKLNDVPVDADGNYLNEEDL